MPPLLTSDVVNPVVHKSPHRLVPYIWVPPSKPLAKPRVYSDEPLPLRPSEHAPRKATIKQRVALPEGVAYTLDVGGVEIADVGINEILDYVSAYDLEQFENRQFEEEREIMRIARQEREAERQRRKQRAKTKGQVIYRTDSDSDSEEDEEVETGKHGRARPTYKHLFKVPDAMRQRRRRRKRDPFTGELMPLSDEEEAAFVAPSEVATSSPRVSATPAGELPKRRRRKRDKITGELLPLSPAEQAAHSSIEKGKRPRRRRHPVTGELMPLGWKYDPNAEQQTYEQRRDAAGSNKTPSIRRLSIAREHDAKRMKLTSEEPSSDDELGRKQSIATSGKRGKTPMSNELRGASSEEPVPVSISKYKSTPRSSTLNPTPQRNSLARPPPSSTSSSSDPKITLASFLKPAKPDEDDDESSSDDSSSAPNQKPNTPGDRGKTSIMNPMATQTEGESDEAEDEDLEEGEWFVEAILGHNLSDPRTHPGKAQIMLYQTKWEGWEKPTWEPEDSFVDQVVLDEYRKRVGLDRAKIQVLSAPKKKSITPTSKFKAAPAVIDESDEDEDEDYEVESILAHHMSDPRTHPGKPAVMLYKVKWLGWAEPTWEPRQSFTDKTVLRQYEKKVGMPVEESEE